MGITPYQAPANISQFIDIQFTGKAYCPALKTTLTTVEEVASTFYNHPVTQAVGKTVTGAIGTAYSWVDRIFHDYTGVSPLTGLQIGSLVHSRATMVVTALLATAMLVQAFIEQPIAMTQNMAIAGAQMAGHAVRQIPSALLETAKAAPRFILITLPVFIATTAFEVLVKLPFYHVPKFLFAHPVIGIPVAAGVAYTGAKAIYSAKCGDIEPLVESNSFLGDLYYELTTFSREEKSAENYEKMSLRLSDMVKQSYHHPKHAQLLDAIAYLIKHPEASVGSIVQEYRYTIVSKLAVLYQLKLTGSIAQWKKSAFFDSSSETNLKIVDGVQAILDTIPAETIAALKEKLTNQIETSIKEKTANLERIKSDPDILQNFSKEVLAMIEQRIQEELPALNKMLSILNANSNGDQANSS